MLEHKKKGRLRCHKRPKSREETPKEGSDRGWGWGVATAYAELRRSRSAAQLNVRVAGRDEGLWALTLKAEHFRNGSFVRVVLAAHQPFRSSLNNRHVDGVLNFVGKSQARERQFNSQSLLM
jgi:hypothetical protein